MSFQSRGKESNKQIFIKTFIHKTLIKNYHIHISQPDTWIKQHQNVKRWEGVGDGHMMFRVLLFWITHKPTPAHQFTQLAEKALVWKSGELGCSPGTVLYAGM